MVRCMKVNDIKIIRKVFYLLLHIRLVVCFHIRERLVKIKVKNRDGV